MANKLGLALGTILSMGFMSGAQAILISGTEVGAVDTLLCARDSAQSDQAYEDAFVKQCTGEDATLAANIDISNSELLTQGIYNAIDVTPNSPGYFLLKFGSPGTPDMFIFENLVNLNFLVWTDDQLAAAGVTERHLNSISHYTYPAGTTKVPEPATISLLGLGLVALGTLRRRRAAISSR